MADTAQAAPPPVPPQLPPPLPVVTATRAACAVLLLAPFVALLWVNSYTRSTPTLIGIPFFYWYQLLWVILSAFLTGGAYLLLRREQARRGRQRREADR
jgi:membrane protein implicated in regulation of membrane protease activity